jgi:hypothetical protein
MSSPHPSTGKSNQNRENNSHYRQNGRNKLITLSHRCKQNGMHHRSSLHHLQSTKNIHYMPDSTQNGIQTATWFPIHETLELFLRSDMGLLWGWLRRSSPLRRKRYQRSEENSVIICRVDLFVYSLSWFTLLWKNSCWNLLKTSRFVCITIRNQ